MFLTIAYTVFLAQTFIIAILLLPVPLKLKKIMTKLFENTVNNTYAKFVLMALIVMTLGLYIESLYSSYRYAGIRHEADELNTGSIVLARNELLVKLFRSQRNMYLTFIVNFYWLILFGIYRYVKNIIALEFENSRLKISLTNTSVDSVFKKDNYDHDKSQ